MGCLGGSLASRRAIDIGTCRKAAPKPLRSSKVRAGPRGQPGAASCGGELPGQRSSHRSALWAGREAKPKPPRAWRAACVTCTQSLALLRDTGRPRGQPEAASHGGKLPGRQPRIAASYIGRPEGRAWAAPSVASRVARGLAFRQNKGRPRGQPGAAWSGGKLLGQQPCIVASYRQRPEGSA